MSRDPSHVPLLLFLLAIALRNGEAEPAATCEATASIVPEPLLFVAVLTSSDRAAHRALLRHTWFNDKHSFADPSVVQGRFFVGSEGQKAQLNHEGLDVITLASVGDSYSELPAKSVAAMHWANEHVRPKFFLRVTDDMLCDVPALVDFLSSLTKTTAMYRGKTMVNVEPERDPRHPNFVSESSHPEKYYPTYVHGAAYLLSADLLAKFRSGEGLTLQEPDDVSLATELLSPLYGETTAQLDPRFWMMDRVGGDEGDECSDDAYVVGELQVEVSAVVGHTSSVQ
jgi:hypothetical protein